MDQADSRRRLPAWAIGAALVVFGCMLAGRAVAAVSCAPSQAAGIERCVAGLAPATLERIYQPQQASNWCWAASVTMVLRRYGLHVDQEEVVRARFGRADNVQVSGQAIGELLTRRWDDHAGRQASSSATLLPPWHRALGLAAPEVLDDLAQGRPLLLGAEQHAVVLVQVVYERRIDGRAVAPAGVRVLRAVVLDPASGQWLRSARSDERLPDFLARVRVEVSAPDPQLAALAAPVTQAR